jgi:hypothetical protein
MWRKVEPEAQRSVWLTVRREDGAFVEMRFYPEDLESIERLTASARDPLALERERDEARRSADYWQDRCLKAEHVLHPPEHFGAVE